MEYTVIVPVYNEADSLVELCERVKKVFQSMKKEGSYEILIVNDGSMDSSEQVIKSIQGKNSNIRNINMRRNMGKSVALTAGFINTDSDYVITMDGDLQDNPENIPQLIDKIREGYDLVSGWKQGRKDSLIRVFGSRLFNSIVSCLGGIRLHDFNCGFKIYRSKVVKSIAVFGQYHRFIPLLAHLMGFKVAEVRVTHAKRKYGSSKYPAIRYQGFFDLLSILFTYRYRFSPLYFFGTLGLIFIVPSVSVISFIAIKHILFVLSFGEDYVSKTRLLLPLSFTTFILGINIFLTGFVCDFILYHQGKDKITELAGNIAEEKV